MAQATSYVLNDQEEPIRSLEIHGSSRMPHSSAMAMLGCRGNTRLGKRSLHLKKSRPLIQTVCCGFICNCKNIQSSMNWINHQTVAGWWFGTSILFSHDYWESHHPTWLSYFSEGWPNHQPGCLSIVIFSSLVGDVQGWDVALRPFAGPGLAWEVGIGSSREKQGQCG